MHNFGVPELRQKQQQKDAASQHWPSLTTILIRDFEQGCGSGLIQSGSGYGSGSSNLAQSGYGSTKSLNPDPIRIRPDPDTNPIHNSTLEDKFFQRFKNEH
jgi:hypothetical protein